MFTGGEFYGELNDHKGLVEFFSQSYTFSEGDQYGNYLISRVLYFNHRIQLLGGIAVIAVLTRIYLEYKRDKPNHWLYEMIQKIKTNDAKL